MILVKKRTKNWGKIEKNKSPKTPKQIERHLKGVANHRRIEILFVISENKGITVENIAEDLNCNIKTISSHIHKLAQAGLVNKKYQKQYVTHELSPYGKTIHKFIKSFSYS